MLNTSKRTNGNDYKVIYYHVIKGSTIVPSGTVGLSLDDQRFIDSSTGNDGIDALCNATDKIVGLGIRRNNRKIEAIGGNPSADNGILHTYKASLVKNGSLFTATGVHFEPDYAALIAYVRAINQIRKSLDITKKT